MIMLSKYEFRGVSLHRYGGQSLYIPTLQDRTQLLGNHMIYPIPLEIKMNYIIIKTNRAGHSQHLARKLSVHSTDL